MIDDLDDVLRQFLIRELPIRNGEVEVLFDQPKREWSSRLSRPTVNIFLYDVRENQKLRQARPMFDIVHNADGTVSKRPKAARLDLHYMITAWAADPEDEHRLLSRTLLALFRYPHLPEELLPESLLNQPAPIHIMVAQYDEFRNATDVWQVMDNEMRPAIACIITLAFDPHLPIVAPLVRTRELRIGPSQVPRLQRLDERVEPRRSWTIGGTLSGVESLDIDQVHLTLVEKGLEVRLQPDGRFAIGPLEAGEFTLEVSVEGRKPRRHQITVPAADYDLEA